MPRHLLSGTLPYFKFSLALYKWDKGSGAGNGSLGRTKEDSLFSGSSKEKHVCDPRSNMGQHNSKSTAEERSILHHDGAEAECQRKDACCSQASVSHMQKKMNNLHHSPRTREKSAVYPWPQSRCDAGGLVYVVDSPTGGVWVKQEQKWTRSWRWWRHRLLCGNNSNHPEMGNADEPPGGSWDEWTKMPQVPIPGPARTLRWTVSSTWKRVQLFALFYWFSLFESLIGQAVSVRTDLTSVVQEQY